MVEKTFRQKLWALYKKDLMNLRLETFLIIGFALVINIYAFAKISSIPDSIKVLTNFWTLSMMVVVAGIFWVFIRSFELVSSEWKDNTLHMIMPLPVNGKTIFLAKLLAILTQAVAVFSVTFSLLLATFGYSVGFAEIANIVRDISQYTVPYYLLLGSIYLLLMFAQLILIVFFSSVVGRMVNKLSGMVTFIVFIVAIVINDRVVTAVSALLGINYMAGMTVETPDTTVGMGNMGSFGQHTTDGIYVSNLMGYSEYLFAVISTIIVGAVFFYLTTYLYERKVEL